MDFQNKDGVFTLYECPRCSVQFWVPFSNPGKDWYEEGDTYSPSQLIKPKVSRGYHKKFLERWGDKKGKTILDVGCGAGEFLAALQARGWNVWGVDFDRRAIQAAKRHFRLDQVFAMELGKFFKDVETPQFDVITCFEVIEHVDDPRKLMENIQNKLHPGGKVILSTPSRERFFANLNTWDFPPNHLTRWNKEAVARLLRPFGFEPTFVVYVEQFRILLESFNGKFSLGLVAKAQAVSKKSSQSITKGAIFLGKAKALLIGALPAAVFYLLGMVQKRKNGGLYLEFERA
ncbi:MAG: class I SAM-dependent methyltransferase [Candidatus Yanofskybacteria bacterium]|nr:class I SAM-dependent methyltransferase [Candidatus Yanofskybacteria bacterium]